MSDAAAETPSAPIGDLVDPQPAERPHAIALQGRIVTLRPIQPDTDAEELYAGSHGPEAEQLWRYMSEGPFPERASFDANLSLKAVSPDRVFFTIVDNASGRAVGQTCYLRIDPANRVIEVGHIFYTPALQRTVGATEAMYLMARQAFEDLGYRRYEWKCNALNVPSRNAALRLGFTFEGVFRQHMIVKGRNRDTAWFAMLDSEWPERKAALQRWLDPSNFDSAGRQKKSLQTIT
ncbi:MAG TPA: GNAT family protein [Bryobacteraceae bacterium]|jgi:RimJ/RimL family protein N-acetyltransferase|nr:GNAT family protein [Bryobacteraceae bacterium]